MLEEVHRVLQKDRIAKRYNLTPGRVNDYLATIREKVELVSAEQPGLPIVEADPSDDLFLIGAVNGKADCIVSGSRHIILLVKHQGIPILSPATFLAFLVYELSKLNGSRSGV